MEPNNPTDQPAKELDSVLVPQEDVTPQPEGQDGEVVEEVLMPPLKKQQTVDKQMVDTVAAIVATKTLSDAARFLDINRSTLYDRIDKYNLREYLDSINATALEVIRASSLKAAINMMSDLDSRHPIVRQNASRYVLDKSLPEQPKVQVNVQNNLMSMSDFVAAMQKRKEERTHED